MTADLFGDWREEIITALPGELRIYSTAIPATDRRVTLCRTILTGKQSLFVQWVTSSRRFQVTIWVSKYEIKSL